MNDELNQIESNIFLESKIKLERIQRYVYIYICITYFNACIWAHKSSDFERAVIKWQLNFLSNHFGVKSYA